MGRIAGPYGHYWADSRDGYAIRCDVMESGGPFFQSPGRGSSALAAVGLWQERAPNQVRALLLVVLCGLAGGFVAANVLALAVSTDGGLPGAPRPLHWGGLVSGALLYASGMLETSRSFFRGRDATD